MVEDNGVTKVHGIGEEVKDREDVSDLRFGSAINLLKWIEDFYKLGI